MPRPLRIRDREAKVAAESPSQEAQTPPIDAQGQTDTIAPAEVAQGDEPPLQRIAKQLGWKTREESDLPPDKYQDEEAYLSRTASEFAALKESHRSLGERLRRQGQVAADLADQAARRARDELAAEIKQAAQAGDIDRVSEATQRLNQATPDARVEAWVGKNSWFRTDPKAEMVARASAEEAKRLGASVEAQLEAAEAEVRKRFPEYFGKDDSPAVNGSGEVRLSDRRAPLVEGGTRTPAPQRSRVKGWNDIPGQDRYQMSTAGKHGPSQLAMFTRKFGGEDAAKQAMAKSYWREQGDAS